MRIVTDGEEYAIEKGWIFKKYCSLYNTGIWWSLEESYDTCWGDWDRVFYIYNKLKGKKIWPVNFPVQGKDE